MVLRAVMLGVAMVRGVEGTLKQACIDAQQNGCLGADGLIAANDAVSIASHSNAEASKLDTPLL